MQGTVPQSKPPPETSRRVSPEELAWLEHINKQLAYDEYMQAKRERWLWERPSIRKTEREDSKAEQYHS